MTDILDNPAQTSFYWSLDDIWSRGFKLLPFMQHKRLNSNVTEVLASSPATVHQEEEPVPGDPLDYSRVGLFSVVAPGWSISRTATAAAAARHR